jgi:PleD family two-component response regulator
MQRLDSDLFKLGRPPRVLVADDDVQNRELIQEICRVEGFEAQGAASGEEALSMLRSEVFDLLLLDASLPGIDGLEVCRTLRADPVTDALPVIIVTAAADESLRDRAGELGVIDVVAKPFRVFELVERMRRALRARSREGDPPTAPKLRVRRRKVDALSALPSPRTLRSRLHREIETALRAARPIVCAIVRLENEASLSASLGRSLTDALLGEAVVGLLHLFQDRVVRADLDELVVLLLEEQLPAFAGVIANAPADRAALEVPPSVEVNLRWGAVVLDPEQGEPDALLAGARAALDAARVAGKPGQVDRYPPDRLLATPDSG